MYERRVECNCSSLPSENATDDPRHRCHSLSLPHPLLYTSLVPHTCLYPYLSASTAAAHFHTCLSSNPFIPYLPIPTSDHPNTCLSSQRNILVLITVRPHNWLLINTHAEVSRTVWSSKCLYSLYTPHQRRVSMSPWPQCHGTRSGKECLFGHVISCTYLISSLIDEAPTLSIQHLTLTTRDGRTNSVSSSRSMKNNRVLLLFL